MLRSEAVGGIFPSCVGGGRFKISLKCLAQRFSCSLSMVRSFPSLFLVEGSNLLWCLPQKSLVIFYICPNSLCCCFFSLCYKAICIEARTILFTFLLASLFCSLCLSCNLHDLASVNFFIRVCRVLEAHRPPDHDKVAVHQVECINCTKLPLKGLRLSPFSFTDLKSSFNVCLSFTISSPFACLLRFEPHRIYS